MFPLKLIYFTTIMKQVIQLI